MLQQSKGRAGRPPHKCMNFCFLWDIDGMTSFTIGLTWSQLLLFTVIGLVDFGLPRVMQIDQSILSGYALTIIFLVVPLDAITTILPRLSKASIALQKIESMNLALASRSEEMSEKSDCVQASTNRIRGYTSKTRLRGLNSLVRAGGLRLYSSEFYSPKTFETLSQGQRKRLALLTAYLEDRPFYVFDEWASDQDPVFKEIFYTQLLPELKSKGKTVLAISHDDRYFHLADRILKLDYGKLI